MSFPIIQVLALLGIVGGVSALAWYSNQSVAEQKEADRLALQWFGRRFKQLSELQQQKVQQGIS